MLYAINEVCINPIEPVKQSGHACQVDPVSTVHDDLQARIIAFEDDKQVFINVSCDNLGFQQPFQREMNEKVKDLFTKPVTCVISSTHTHYAGDSKEKSYYRQCINQIYDGIKSLKFKESDLKISYKSIEYNGVGTSRITNHKALVLLNLIQIFDKENEVIDIINYNCHPTILKAEETNYFSAEYVGYALKTLSKNFNTYFTFLQGAAGDVSTRFTRTGQDYAAVIELGNKFVEKITELKQAPCNLVPLTLGVESVEIPVEVDFTDIDASLMPTNLSEREIYTIGQGKVARQNLKLHPESLQKELQIVKLDLGPVRIIFTPNELFSYYLGILDTSKAFIACYSNGYSPYVAPIDQIIFTYETFTDVLSKATKQKLIDTIKQFN